MKNIIVKIIVLLAVVLLFSDCSTKMTILLDGCPIPKSSLVLRSPVTGMRLEAVVYEKSKKKKKKMEVKYLDVGSTDTVVSSVGKVGFRIRIVNPLKKKYAAVVVYSLLYKGEEYPYVIKHCIYGGQDVDRLFSFSRSCNNLKKVSVRFQVIGGGNKEVFNVMLLKYSVRKGGDAMRK